MAVLPTGIGPVTGGYNIERSLRFNFADSAYLNRTPGSASNRTTWTYSYWFKGMMLKPGVNDYWALSAFSDGNNYTAIRHHNEYYIDVLSFNAGSAVAIVKTQQVFRDPSAWNHIVVTFDTSNATQADRVRIYHNGVLCVIRSGATYPGSGSPTGWVNSTSAHYIGSQTTEYFDGYMTEINLIDGQALTPSSFGETDSATGVWKPKAYTGTYGTNGFYLPFKTASNWGVYFDGTGDYLTVANNAALNFGTSAFTVECWFYRTSSAAVYGLWSLNSTTSGYAGARAQINTNGSIDVYISQNGSSWANSITNRGSTTVNTWNHLAVVRESNGDIKIYINGTQAGATVTNANSLYAGTSHLIGGVYSGGSPSSVFPGYISNLRSVVGTAVYTGNFTPPTAQLTAVTNTQLLTCQSSTFVDNSTNALTVTASGDSRPQQFSPFTLDVTDDHSGTGNNWQPNNLDLRTTGVGADILVDSPTAYGTDTGVGGEVRGNYATWNPLDKDDGITSVTNGNLNVVTNGSNGSIKSTIAFPSGKWYWEVTSDTVNSGGTQAVGIIPQSQPPTNNMSDSGKLGYALDVSNSDRKFENGTATSYGTYTQANGAVYMLAFDQTAGKLWYGINGTWLASGDPAAGTNASSSSISTSTAYCAAVSDNTVSGTFTANFGQRAFAYTAPSGFKALCTTNLPTPTIGATSTTQANKYFNVVTFSGNGSQASVTGVGFQPEFIWAKNRTNAYNHELWDAVRGVNSTLFSNATSAEDTTANRLVSFNSDGFTYGTSSNLYVNATNSVAWCWDAAGSNATNTSGTITSTVRANTTSGFSIVTYTGNGTNGATVGHGLGIAPSMVIVKNRAAAEWPVYHTSLTSGNRLNLNGTDAQFAISVSSYGGVSAVSSTTFTCTTGAVSLRETNLNTNIYVAYCFAPVAGYSAFGRYTGNGSTDGPFVYTNFRPRFVLWKRSDGAESWWINDTSRLGYNGANRALFPNASSAEDTANNIDILSNGFKIRGSGGEVNASGGTYIYAAFAETPAKFSLAR